MPCPRLCAAPRPAVRRDLRRRSRAAGFTLIEVVLAAGLIALLVGGIYAVARGAFRIGNEVVANQQRSTLVSSFVELCRRTFEEMPGNGKIELVSSNVGTFTTELILTDYPLAFTWSGVPAGAAQVILSSEKSSRGDLLVKVQYLTAEEAEARSTRGITGGGLGASLTLLENVELLQWRFYDTRTEEWETEWTEPERRPSLVEMTLGIFGEETVRSVFWIPTVANPETLAQGFQGGGATGAAGGGGGGGGGAAGQPGFDLPTDPAARRRALEELRRRGGPPGGGGRGGPPGGGAGRPTPGGPAPGPRGG